MKKIMIHDLQSRSSSKNYDRTSDYKGSRCELCQKPVGENPVSILCNTENLYLPTSENDVNETPKKVPLGSDCFKKLKRYAKKYGFKIILSK